MLTIIIDCGSSIYSQPGSMPDVSVIRGGLLDDGAGDVKIGLEFFTKDRKNYNTPVEGAQQNRMMT